MIKLVDLLQRRTHAITVCDTILADDASDLKLPTVVSPKQFARLQRAMFPHVDFPGVGDGSSLDDPAGPRIGRVAFAGTIEGDDRVRRLLGFSIAEHARITDLLRASGAGARLFIAASMLSAACSRYDKARGRTDSTGRQQGNADQRDADVEAALISTARIATEALPTGNAAPHGIQCISKYQTHRKAPETGARHAFANPDELKQTTSVPRPRILSDELWDRVKARQKSLLNPEPTRMAISPSGPSSVRAIC